MLTRACQQRQHPLRALPGRKAQLARATGVRPRLLFVVPNGADAARFAVLPPEVPIPPIAEVQQAMAFAAEKVAGVQGANLKQRMRTGTVVTTDDRNWELRYTDSALRFSQSRAVAIDMESATIAAQGYRFRVPYGTLLCVSDKPLHGEIKLPGQANRFYEEAIAAHLQIGIQTCELLREAGVDELWLCSAKFLGHLFVI